MQEAEQEYRDAFVCWGSLTYDDLGGRVRALRLSKRTRIGESVIKCSKANPVPHEWVFGTKSLSPRNTYDNGGNDLS